MAFRRDILPPTSGSKRKSSDTLLHRVKSLFGEYSFQGYNVLYFGERMTFRRNILSPSSGSTNKRSNSLLHRVKDVDLGII
jgi:hypothetical protein